MRSISKYRMLEQDCELGLAEHGVRKYDEAIGRFTAPDALWEKYVGWSPYQYSLNNPVMFQDGNGYLPLDLFGSPKDAAHDFGKNYNPISLAMNMEVATTIYSYTDPEGNVSYTYAVPNMFGDIGANASLSEINEEGFEKVAEAHTHGAYESRKINPDDFSPDDKRNATGIEYLITPGGFLKMYNPKEPNKVKVITKDMPKDKGSEDDNIDALDNILEKRPIPLEYNSTNGFVKTKDAVKVIKNQKRD